MLRLLLEFSCLTKSLRVLFLIGRGGSNSSSFCFDAAPSTPNHRPMIFFFSSDTKIIPKLKKSILKNFGSAIKNAMVKSNGRGNFSSQKQEKSQLGLPDY